LGLSLSGGSFADDVPVPDGIEVPKKAKWEPKGSVKTSFYDAELKAKGEKYEEAEAVLRDVLAGQPGCGQALVSLAWVVEEQDRIDEAIAILRFTSSLFPEEDELYRKLSSLFFRQKDYESAAKAAREALTVNTRSFEGQRLLTRALIRLGQHSEAIDSLNTARAEREGKDYDCLEVYVQAHAGEMELADTAWAECEASSKKWLKGRAEQYMVGARGEIAELGSLARDNGDVDIARMAEVVGHLRDGSFEKACKLTKRLSQDHEDAVDVRLAHGVCTAENGDRDAGRELLATLLVDAAWAELDAETSPYGVLMDRAPSAITELMRDGAFHLVRYYAEGEDADAAKAMADELSSRWAEDKTTVAAQILVMHVQGASGDAWTALETAWADTEDRSKLEVVARSMHERDPEGAPEAIKSALGAE
jgi:tetratricopeptide (TPR) repeat protein